MENRNIELLGPTLGPAIGSHPQSVINGPPKHQLGLCRGLLVEQIIRIDKISVPVSF